VDAILREVSCARIPASSLGALAALRASPDVGVVQDGDRPWILFREGNERALIAVLAVPGAELYERREGRFRRHGSRLPCAGPPPVEALPLHRALVPEPLAIPALEPGFEARAKVELVRASARRETSAALCSLPELARWAEKVSSIRLSAIRAARAGERLLLLGEKLPGLPCCERFHGDRVLVPLGFRVEPDLGERALREALGIAEDELLIFRADGSEIVPLAAFAPLTRGAIRLALGAPR